MTAHSYFCTTENRQNRRNGHLTTEIRLKTQFLLFCRFSGGVRRFTWTTTWTTARERETDRHTPGLHLLTSPPFGTLPWPRPSSWPPPPRLKIGQMNAICRPIGRPGPYLIPQVKAFQQMSWVWKNLAFIVSQPIAAQGRDPGNQEASQAFSGVCWGNDEWGGSVVVVQWARSLPSGVDTANAVASSLAHADVVLCLYMKLVREKKFLLQLFS